MPRVTENPVAVKSPGLPRHVVEQKAIQVGAFVRSRMRASTPTQDHDDVYQEAVLWALEWAERYGGKFEGDNPFTTMSAVAFRRVVHAVRKAQHQASVSEHVTQGRLVQEVAPGRAVPIAGCGYGDGIDEDGVSAVQVGEAAREPALPGEDLRRRQAAQVLRSLAPDERRLVRDTLAGQRPRSKIGQRRARRVLGRFAAAIGPDDSIAAVRRAARDPRLPPPNTVLEVQRGRGRAELLVGIDTFTYRGQIFRSISAAAARAAADIGMCTKAQNGYEFWGIGQSQSARA